jgi:hypothetical protein
VLVAVLLILKVKVFSPHKSSDSVGKVSATDYASLKKYLFTLLPMYPAKVTRFSKVVGKTLR